jgi:O-antigen ligase
LPVRRLGPGGWPLLLGPIVALAPITNVNFLSLATLTVALLYGVKSLARKTFPTPTSAEVLVLLFAGYAVVSLLWSETPSPVATVIAYSGAGVMFVMAFRRSTSFEAWRFLAYSYLAGCGVAAWSVIGGSIGREQLFGEERVSVEGVNANFTAYAILTGVPLLLGLYWEASRFRRLGGMLTAAGLAAAGWAIALSGSRGAAIGFIATLVFTGVRALGLRTRGALLMVGIVTAVALGYLQEMEDILPARLLARAPGGMEDVSSGRYALWSRALEEFERHPWLGSGADSYLMRAGGGIHVHNVFLSVLAELGIVGLVLFTAMLVAIAQEFFGGESPEWTAAVRSLVVLVWFIIAMTGVWQYALPAWFVFGWAANVPRRSLVRGSHP